MKPQQEFFNLYNHDFARVAVCVPRCRIADPAYNAAETVRLLVNAAAHHASLAVFPELGLSAYTCDDLFHQRALLDASEAALATVLEATRNLSIVAVVGMPLRVDHRLFNCAVVLHRGRILGVVPKSYLPNYGEFYEARQFNSADEVVSDQIVLFGRPVPFGAKLLFVAEDQPFFVLHTEICEDVWVPIPPSCYAALAGATVLANLSASNITVGKSSYRHQLVEQQSARCVAAYLYSSAGMGESSTDLAWDGQALIAENGEILAESQRFIDGSHTIFADIDLERISRERMRQTSFGQSVRHHADSLKEFRKIGFRLEPDRSTRIPLDRQVERMPYVPSDPAQRDERCMEVFHIQVQALVQRMTASGIRKLAIGVSGGLDSTHALLVCAKAMDVAGLPRSNILAYTMPGFATGDRTKGQAWRLMEALGCTAREIDIRPSCLQMLKDIGHPFADGQPVYDVTFENVQAGERTNHLFRLANHHGAMVVGTGDLSELAMGWCTYGVGDHMSHYNVNASVPKTLIQYQVRWVAETQPLNEEGRQALLDILDTEISPELVPADTRGEVQSSEQTVGRYCLQDFNLYYILRFGYAPAKVAFLSHAAWGSRQGIQEPSFEIGEIKRTLGIFLNRFFAQSQFKRTCVPNGPKVGSGGSLSPRGDWRAPTDADARTWLDALEAVPDVDRAAEVRHD